jgi:hypothetical protein
MDSLGFSERGVRRKGLIENDSLRAGWRLGLVRLSELLEPLVWLYGDPGCFGGLAFFVNRLFKKRSSAL